MTIPISTLEILAFAVLPQSQGQGTDRAGGCFCRGGIVVRRLLGSDYPVESVFASDLRLPKIAPLCRKNIPLFVTSQQVMHG